MTEPKNDEAQPSIIKVVYFDEESASDFLDISAGGKSAVSSEKVRDRTTKTHEAVSAKVDAKFSWLPFLGASASAGAGLDAAQAGQSILRKTLSNTILTDYLVSTADDGRVAKLRTLRVTAPKGSMAYTKMFTPYMVMMKIEDAPIDLARIDETLAGAKGYYELLGEDTVGKKLVLRFNIKAFRNNYGLTDLARMDLIYHGICVGRTSDQTLGMESEMASSTSEVLPSAAEFLDGKSGEEEGLLEVFDVLFAGVEHRG